MPSTTRQLPETVPDTPAAVLAALREEQDLRSASEVRSMVLAAHWVALHPVLDDTDPGACFQSPKTLAGEGSPAIDEFCIPEVATMLGQTCDSVGSYLTSPHGHQFHRDHTGSRAIPPDEPATPTPDPPDQ